MMKPKCLRCTHYEDSTWCHEANTTPCTDIDMPCEYFKPMINADHIRSMSDEELAGFLAELNLCKMPPFVEKRNESFYKSILDWLKQPKENEE